MYSLPPTKLKKWIIESSEDISPSKWMPIRKDMVQIPNGKVIDFYFVNIANAAMVFSFTKEKELILVRQYKHGTGDIIIEGPAGMIEEGSTPEDTAVKELEEEAGIKIDKSQLISLGVHSQSPTKMTHRLYGYLVLDVEINSSQNFDENEEIEVLKIPAKACIDLIKSGEIWASDTVAYILKIKLLYPEIFE